MSICVDWRDRFDCGLSVVVGIAEILEDASQNNKYI